MSSCHRPDFNALREHGKTHRLKETHSEAYLWPYINLGGLLKPTLFLLFLNSRACPSPDKFFMADLKAFRLGFENEALAIKNLESFDALRR